MSRSRASGWRSSLARATRPTPRTTSGRASSKGITPGWNFGVNNSPDQPPDNTYPQCYTSYGGSSGMWGVEWQNSYLASSPGEYTQLNGVIYCDSIVTIAQITDGTSNTFLFGEHSRTNLQIYDPGYALSDGQWNSGRPYDTMICTFYPPNPGLSGGNIGSAANIVNSGFYPYSASSQHPGGVNMAFCDGSVKFIKNTVSSWSFNAAGTEPNGVTYSSSTYTYTINAGAFIGIWQQLSTRNGGEVVSADQY